MLTAKRFHFANAHLAWSLRSVGHQHKVLFRSVLRPVHYDPLHKHLRYVAVLLLLPGLTTYIRNIHNDVVWTCPRCDESVVLDRRYVHEIY